MGGTPRGDPGSPKAAVVSRAPRRARQDASRRRAVVAQRVWRRSRGAEAEEAEQEQGGWSMKVVCE